VAEGVFRHRNGGGSILGIECSIGSDCFLSRDSVISGKAHVSFMSQIHSGSMLHDAHVSASGISGSVIDGGHISYASVKDSSLENVIVRGTYDPARLENVILRNGVVAESCWLRNFELSGPHLLHANWDRAPRHHSLKLEYGIPLVITECTELRGHVGCECRPMQTWLDRKELLRRIFVGKRGWPSAAIDTIGALFEGWKGSPR